MAANRHDRRKAKANLNKSAKRIAKLERQIELIKQQMMPYVLSEAMAELVEDISISSFRETYGEAAMTAAQGN